ncbi:MAG: hypothetical protein JWM85_3303 [Acidimicrobiaceae bacterium]|nr:hypothetical protein [Acidimicrobiaceae bacterium]
MSDYRRSLCGVPEPRTGKGRAKSSAGDRGGTTAAMRLHDARTFGRIARLLVAHRDLFAGPGSAPETTEAASPAEHESAERLADALEAEGPTFVKLGQLLSTRADLLPPVYLEALARLQDRVEPFPDDEARKIFATEIGVGVDEAFSFFADRPLAAASLGQVYPARLREGAEVVVKIQRPGVNEQVRADLAALGSLARLVDAHSDAGRRFGFADAFEEFESSFVDELDYTREAANLRRLGESLAEHPLVVVPQPVRDFSNERVLTMERIAGHKVTDLSPVVMLEVDGKALAEALYVAYLDQIFVQGFFHADPHPGNVLLTEDHRLALVDLGMVGYLGAQMRSQLLRLVLALGDGDGDAVADVLVRIGTRLEEFDESAARRQVGATVARASGGGQKSDVGQSIMALARACALSGLRPPAELSMLARATISLERVVRVLDPEGDPAEVLQRHASDILRDEGTSTRSALASGFIEMKDLVEHLPGRLNRLVGALSRGEMRVKVDAFDEVELLRGLQRIANRVAMGVVIAALVLAAAVFAVAPTSSRVLGYPPLALAFLLLAGVLCVGFLATILNADGKLKRRRRR